jgi:hypothetical protein
LSNNKPKLSAVLIVVAILALGLVGGYVIGSDSTIPPTITTTLTISTVSTSTLVTMTQVTTTTTQVGPQYLTASQGMAEGGQLWSVGCISYPCSVTPTSGPIIIIPGMTYFYSQVNVNTTTPAGVSAAVSSRGADEIEVAISNSTPNNACFEILLQMDGKSVQIGAAMPVGAQLPPTIYVWYVGQTGC